MNENIKAESTFTELNKVAGFDPLKFARKVIREGAEFLHLDLKYKKLWFRLKYPQGKIKVSPLKITDQFAIIEAKVFFDKNDAEPVSSYISQRYAKDIPGRLYIESAHQTAVDQALSDAGFGLQLLSAQPKAAVQVAKEAPSLRVVPAPPKSQEALLTKEPTPPPEKQVEVVISTEDAAEKVVQEESPVIHEVKAILPPPVEEPAAIETATEEPVQVNEDEAPDQLPYTADMPVDDICSMMTLEEAGKVIVDIGMCNGWPLQQVAERRPISLKWYLKDYDGDNNILRAGAKLFLNSLAANKAG